MLIFAWVLLTLAPALLAVSALLLCDSWMEPSGDQFHREEPVGVQDKVSKSTFNGKKRISTSIFNGKKRGSTAQFSFNFKVTFFFFTESLEKL